MPWSVTDYNTNPALNTAINGVDIAENSAAAGYNDALRQMMADIKAWITANGVTYPVSIANGGTGQTNAAASLAALGGLDVSFRDLVIVGKNASFTFSNSERAYGIVWNGAGGTATINPHSTTPINDGAVYAIGNFGGGVLTLTPGAGVNLYKNGSAVSSSAALAIKGMGTLINWGVDNWTINGSGIS